ncbi:response regulator transcription factor [Thermoactinospora rubra]|uniref:response regulator transcription factor n=1 Tax=Thermoactinospora rubra TaxID=1088767 RepID=UPI000A10B367|nr:response regulator transcription factor [Thermoactinospora rubra]
MIKVLIAEDARIPHETLAAVLELEEDLAVVATVERGDEVVPAAIGSAPDVAVIDIDLPEVDGLTAAASLREKLPGCRSLVLTGLAKPGYLRRAVACGVTGFVFRHSPPGDLIAAIRKVAAGEQVVDPRLAVAALRRADNPLAAREADVLRLAATGAEPDEIAVRLSLSKGTVRNYLSSAVVKLNARSRVDAIRIASDEGWI